MVSARWSGCRDRASVVSSHSSMILYSVLRDTRKLCGGGGATGSRWRAREGRREEEKDGGSEGRREEGKNGGMEGVSDGGKEERARVWRSKRQIKVKKGSKIYKYIKNLVFLTKMDEK